METMDETDPELAEEIKKRMFVFEDIAKLENKDIQTVIRELDQKDLILALKGVDDSVKDRIFSNMSKRSASLIKEEIEFLGQVRLKDVEEAQQKIVGITRKLESENKLIIIRGEEDSYL
jgi:flagellar motor switch protein FliG